MTRKILLEIPYMEITKPVVSDSAWLALDHSDVLRPPFRMLTPATPSSFPPLAFLHSPLALTAYHRNGAAQYPCTQPLFAPLRIRPPRPQSHASPDGFQWRMRLKSLLKSRLSMACTLTT